MEKMGRTRRFGRVEALMALAGSGGRYNGASGRRLQGPPGKTRCKEKSPAQNNRETRCASQQRSNSV